MKEKCKEWALQWKEKAGKFPSSSDWLIRQNNSPIGRTTLAKIFNGYNNFRKYCNEPEIVRTEEITLEWIKQNCTINENGCWVWGRIKNSKGYGYLNNKLIHRISYELVNGKIPEGLIIRHKCDNKPCCNPKHLEIGTYKDNNLDTQERSIYTKLHNNSLVTKTRNLSLQEKVKFYISVNNIIYINNRCIESKIKKYNDYLYISYNNKNYLLHRLIVAQNENLDYDDKSWVARHVCNNKRCINPEHLKSGTHSENRLDSREHSKSTKLTKEQVIEIKADWKNNSSSYKYKKDFDEFWANKFNVSKNCVCDIRLARRWNNLLREQALLD